MPATDLTTGSQSWPEWIRLPCSLTPTHCAPTSPAWQRSSRASLPLRPHFKAQVHADRRLQMEPGRLHQCAKLAKRSAADAGIEDILVANSSGQSDRPADGPGPARETMVAVIPRKT